MRAPPPGSILAGFAGLTVLVIAIPAVRDGSIDGVFLASLPLVAFAAFEAVQPLGDAFREVELSRAAAVRTFEIADAPAPVPEPAHALPLPSHPSVELRHVRFRYDERSPLVLDDLSLSLRPGEWLGLTGPSGAGKTTIVGLLLRFVDAGSGTVLLDGVDVGRFRSEEVRARIGVVPQQVYLFNGTLRDNLLVADGGADDTRIARACDRAGLGPFVRSLPSGFDTLVGDDGLKLSGGERQRVAIARVFLKDSPILILDEATANLDAATESEVLANVRDFARGKSVLVISHRPAALELADRVITLIAAADGARSCVGVAEAMPEDMNLEIAGALSGAEEREASEKRRWEELVEIVEVVILAIVAVATAWSGYQAARWDGRQAFLYGASSTSAFRGGSRRDAGCGAATPGHHDVQHVDPGAPTGRRRAGGSVRSAFQPRVPDRVRRVAGDAPLLEPGRAAGPDLHARVPQPRLGTSGRAERTGPLDVRSRHRRPRDRGALRPADRACSRPCCSWSRSPSGSGSGACASPRPWWRAG